MALIVCPECKKEISDKATSCVHCGIPISKEKSQIIELTSKELKKQLMNAIVLAAVGFIGMILTSMSGLFKFTTISAIIAGIGVVWAGIIQIKIWWHHG